MYVVNTKEAMEPLVVNLKKWLPDHQPILTCVGVKELALEGMRLEIEVIADVEEMGK